MTTDGSSKADAGHCPVPVVRGGIVSRPGLFERLGRAPRVTRISAPAGSGKTFLIRSWLFESGLADRAAWVTLQADGPVVVLVVAGAEDEVVLVSGGARPQPFAQYWPAHRLPNTTGRVVGYVEPRRL